MIPAKPATKPIIHVICFGDDGAFIIIIYYALSNKRTEFQSSFKFYDASYLLIYFILCNSKLLKFFPSSRLQAAYFCDGGVVVDVLNYLAYFLF